MNSQKEKKWLHSAFEFGIIIKGIDGVLEVLGGLLFLLVPSNVLTTALHQLLQQELIQAPDNPILTSMIHFVSSIPAGTLVFAGVYALLNGVIKLGIFWGVWYKKLWMYPVAGVILFLFIAYQTVTLFQNPSFFLLLFNAIDILILLLLHFEYKRVKENI